MSPGLAPPYPWWRRGNYNTTLLARPGARRRSGRQPRHATANIRTHTPAVLPTPAVSPRPDHSEPSLAPLPPSELRPLAPPRAAAAPKRAISVWRFTYFSTCSGAQGKNPASAGHRSIGRGSCRSARADGVERRSTAVVLGKSLKVYFYLLLVTTVTL